MGWAAAQPPPPQLTQPVNDFASVIDRRHAEEIEALIRSLQQATGDVVVVATIETVSPYADIREYAVKMFENSGRGVGERGRDNGLLILLAVKDRRVWVEVGYDLEQFITDGFAGQTSRQEMAPQFARGEYGAGLLAGTARIIERIAEGRNVTIQAIGAQQRARRSEGAPPGSAAFLGLVVLMIILSVVVGRLERRHRFNRRRWGRSLGWHSGVGPFGGGFGGLGGGGFGGGFGGFGGGRSGGGGGGASW